ncbi:hypothetical protein EDB85DRAFT_1884839 [Lactarius pseudohatsudake]|nr:hypothetical protein EDB85DRAFT_1884839 [Lactarius pseudohatsudake]
MATVKRYQRRQLPNEPGGAGTILVDVDQLVDLRARQRTSKVGLLYAFLAVFICVCAFLRGRHSQHDFADGCDDDTAPLLMIPTVRQEHWHGQSFWRPFVTAGRIVALVACVAAATELALLAQSRSQRYNPFHNKIGFVGMDALYYNGKIPHWPHRTVRISASLARSWTAETRYCTVQSATPRAEFGELEYPNERVTSVALLDLGLQSVYAKETSHSSLCVEKTQSVENNVVQGAQLHSPASA